MYTTEQYEGMIAETITIKGANGDEIHTYFARPQGPGPFPAVVVIHHLPGWDETYRDFTRKLAHHGYLAISPDLYCRDAHGVPEDELTEVHQTIASWPMLKVPRITSYHFRPPTEK